MLGAFHLPILMLAAVALAASVAPPVRAQVAGTQAEADRGPESVDLGRIFLDTVVTDVRVDERMTIATMDESEDSACPSNAYVFARDRSKWLYQTGRLIQAMRERTPIRVSFSCVDGVQSINAIQFLEPSQDALAAAMPGRERAVEAEVRASVAPLLPAPPIGSDAVPTPTDDGQGEAIGARTVPLPPPLRPPRSGNARPADEAPQPAPR